MRSPSHWDGVALRHEDPWTRYFEDAVDDADDEAEAKAKGAVNAVEAVPVVSKPVEQVGSVPPASAGSQPEGRAA